MSLEKHKTTIDAINLTYYTSGKGRPILFLHGGRVRALTFKKNIELLSKNYLVIAPDIPGHGDSSTPQEIWSFTDYAEFFSKFLEKLKLSDVTIIGYSFGGGIAFNLATKYKNTSKLILIDAGGIKKNQSNELVSDLKRLFFYIIHTQYFSIFLTLIYEWFLFKKKHFINTNINAIREKCYSLEYDLFKNIKVPTLILWGKDDWIFPIEQAFIFQKEIINTKLDIIDGNHDWSLYNPSLFIKKVEKFLSL